MSKETPQETPVIHSLDPTPEVEAEVQVKESFWSKTKRTARKHKTPALAVVGLLGLVGVAAVAGRKSAPTGDLILQLENPESDSNDEDILAETTDDTTVA